ncbi:hypothetical protein U9Z24_04080 [Escherichia coli]
MDRLVQAVLLVLVAGSLLHPDSVVAQGSAQGHPEATKDQALQLPLADRANLVL